MVKLTWVRKVRIYCNGDGKPEQLIQIPTCLKLQSRWVKVEFDPITGTITIKPIKGGVMIEAE